MKVFSALMAVSLISVAGHSYAQTKNVQMQDPTHNIAPEKVKTNVSGSVEATQGDAYEGTFQNTGINYRSAHKIKDGFVIRVKRLIKPGSDTAKEIIGNVPVVSTVANVFTLGLFKRVTRPTGANMRAAWMAVNCKNSTFDVNGDGYKWQDIYNDAYAQAEDLYFRACEPSSNPPYLQFKSASPSLIAKIDIDNVSSFPQSMEYEIKRREREVAEAALCDRRMRKYGCSWSKYLEANPSVMQWAESNPEMAEREKAKLRVSD